MLLQCHSILTLSPLSSSGLFSQENVAKQGVSALRTSSEVDEAAILNTNLPYLISALEVRKRLYFSPNSNPSPTLSTLPWPPPSLPPSTLPWPAPSPTHSTLPWPAPSPAPYTLPSPAPPDALEGLDVRYSSLPHSVPYLFVARGSGCAVLVRS